MRLEPIVVMALLERFRVSAINLPESVFAETLSVNL
jgi:hypothetical protein